MYSYLPGNLDNRTGCLDHPPHCKGLELRILIPAVLPHASSSIPGQALLGPLFRIWGVDGGGAFDHRSTSSAHSLGRQPRISTPLRRRASGALPSLRGAGDHPHCASASTTWSPASI